MDYFEGLQDSSTESLTSLWDRVAGFVPELVGAILVLLIGLILANVLAKLAHKIVELTKVDSLVKKIDATKKLADAGLKINFAGMIAWIVKWFIIIVTFMTVVDILSLDKVNEFLTDVALYVPNVVVAIVILAIGLVVGQFIFDVVEKSAKTSKVTKHTADVLATSAKWSIITFAVLAGLVQLGIAPNLIEILLQGLVAALALGFGLAFGLGGKETANKWLAKNVRK